MGIGGIVAAGRNMVLASFGRTWRIVLATAILASLAVGCGGERSPLDRAGVSLVPGEGWSPRDPASLVTLGRPLAAWDGPGGASLVVATTLPIPKPDPKACMIELATRWSSLPETEVVVRNVETRGGLEAGRVEAIAPGTGGSIAPSGLGRPIATSGTPTIPTRSVVLTFPRRGDTLTLTWRYPEAARRDIAPAVEAALGSLKIADPAASSASY